MRAVHWWIALVALLVLCGDAHAKTLKIATAAPDGLEFMRKVRAAAKQIEEESEGRVRFKIYPGGVQGDDQTVLRKIRVGQLHGGMVAGGALADFYPDLQVYNLPLGFENYEEVDYIRERMDSTITRGLEEAGIITFGLTETGFAYIYSNRPVRSLDDIHEIKAWVPDEDRMSQVLFRSFGISPIPLKFGDVLAGLQTGLIDAAASPPVVTIAMQWHTRVKYVTDMPLMYIYSMLMLDAKAFRQLRSDDQALVRRVMNGVFADIDRGNRQDNREAFQALLAHGLERVRPSADQLAEWRRQSRLSIAALVEDGTVSPEIVATFLDHVNSYRDASGDPEVTAGPD